MLNNLEEIFAPLKFHKRDQIEGSFFPHVEIHKGEIYFDEEVGLEFLLHEIGHLALVPARIRGYISGSMDSVGSNGFYEFFFTDNEDHLIVWQREITDQLNLPEYCKYLEKSDEECYSIIDKKEVSQLFNRLGMGYNLTNKTFSHIVSPLS